MPENIVYDNPALRTLTLRVILSVTNIDLNNHEVH